MTGIRRRRHRRRVTVGASAVLLLTLALPIAARGPNHVDSADAVVPWKERVVVAPGISLRDPRPAAAACDAAVLGEPSLDTANGVTRALSLTNTGTSRCTLAGQAVLVATDPATGVRRTIDVQPYGARSEWKQFPATIDPREVAAVDVLSCTPSEAFRDPAVRIGTREFALPGFTAGQSCRPDVGSWYVSAKPSESDLTATVQAPGQVRRGQRLDYVVTITNPTARPATLEPCPAFTQSLSAGSASWWALNCTTNQIPPGGSVRFAMRLTAPADLIEATAVLRWKGVLDGRVIEAAAAVQVLP